MPRPEARPGALIEREGAPIGRFRGLRSGQLRGVCEALGLALLALGTAALLFLAIMPLASGWRVVVVEGASMEPAIPFGGIELVSPSPQRLEPGEIVLYRNPDRPGRIVTHRVVAISDDGQFITTKGDANRDEDAPVASTDVVGHYEGSLPFVGYAIAALRSGLGRKAAISLPGLALCAVELTSVAGAFRRRRRKLDMPASAARTQAKHEPPGRWPHAVPSACLPGSPRNSSNTPHLGVRTAHQRPGHVRAGCVDRMNRNF